MTLTKVEEPTVRSFEPPARLRNLIRIGNVVMVPLLRSGFGARMRDLALLSFTGRRSGRRYSVPVGYHELGTDGVILTASGWRTNLRGGADVEVTTRGREQRMHAELVEDPDEVAAVYGALLERVGLAKATRVGLKVAGDRLPSHEELVAAIGGRRAVVRLTPR